MHIHIHHSMPNQPRNLHLLQYWVHVLMDDLDHIALEGAEERHHQMVKPLSALNTMGRLFVRIGI